MGNHVTYPYGYLYQGATLTTKRTRTLPFLGVIIAALSCIALGSPAASASDPDGGFNPLKGANLPAAHTLMTHECRNELERVPLGYDYVMFHDGAKKDRCLKQFKESFDMAIWWKLVTDFQLGGAYNLIKTYGKYVDSDPSLAPSWMVMNYYLWQEQAFAWTLPDCMYEAPDGTMYLMSKEQRRGSDGYPYWVVIIRKLTLSETIGKVNCNN